MDQIILSPEEMIENLNLPAVHDDELFARAAAEGYGFKDVWEACSWAREAYEPSSSNWPNCGCDNRCKGCRDARFVVSSSGGVASQTIDPRTGNPLPPESNRLEQEAMLFGAEHARAQPWLLQLYDWETRCGEF